MVSEKPAYLEGEVGISRKANLEEFIGKLKKEVDKDQTSRMDWVKQRQENWKRRYAVLDRNVDYPWRGASSIVVPIADMTIDKVKAQLLSLITGVSPTFHFIANNPASVDTAADAEAFFEWLLKTGTPDFIWQMTIATDDMLQGGFATVKTTWEYETELETTLIELKRLPGRLRGLHVLPNATEAQAQQIVQATGGKVQPMTKERFDAMAPQIKQAVMEGWDLSEDDKVDKKAIDQIMRFFRSGEMSTVVTYRVATKNNPCVQAVDPINVIVPPWTGLMSGASRITHRVFLSEEQLMQRVDSANWNEEAAKLILSTKANRGRRDDLDNMTGYNEDRSYREGIFDYDYEDLMQFYETCCYFDFEGTGRARKATLIWHPASRIPLKAVPFPYDHGKWPWTYIPFELNDARWYSPRGIVEKIKDLDEEITHQHRAKLNRMTIANSPTFKFKRNSGFNPGRIRWVPGDFYGVQRMDDFEAVQMPNLDISFEREENILRSTIENYVGTPDFAITGPEAGSSTRTAREIDLIAQRSQTALGYRSTLYQTGMKELGGQIWDLWNQYGDDKVFINVANGEPKHMTKAEIQGDYDLIPVGSIGSSSPAQEEQKALIRLQAIAQFGPLVEQDPSIEINYGQALLDYLMKGDRVSSKRVIRRRSPEEIAQIEAQQKQQAATEEAIASNSEPVRLSVLKQTLDQTARKAPAGDKQKVLLG